MRIWTARQDKTMGSKTVLCAYHCGDKSEQRVTVHAHTRDQVQLFGVVISVLFQYKPNGSRYQGDEAVHHTRYVQD